MILPLRSGKSAAKYATIWTPEGSPLKLWTEKQAKLLQGWLGEHGHRVKVRYAMRYGNPSIASQLDALQAEGADPDPGAAGLSPVFGDDDGQRRRRGHRLVVTQAQPARTALREPLSRRPRLHRRRWPAASSATGRSTGAADHLVMSFHGVPERTLHLGDPYHCECQKTARLLAAHSGWRRSSYSVTFQSRFGKAKWLEPYTEPTLRALAQRGLARVDVVCPGFTGDCLETLEEIAQEGPRCFPGFRRQGVPLHPLPERRAGLDRRARRAGRSGIWPAGRRADAPDAQALAASRVAAVAMGAKQ